jgi:hypothetical protein
MVAIVTRVVGNPVGNISTLLTPTVAATLSLVSPGAAVTETLKAVAFNRHLAFGAANDLRSQPDIQFDWEPSVPLVVPSGWSLVSATASDQGQAFSCYGYLISDGDARELGFDVSTASAQTDRRWIQTGLAATNGTQTLIAARTGMSIQILDIYARLQPEQGGTTAKMTLQQTDGDTVMDFINHCRANTSEWKLSPGIYLEPGVGLRLIGNAGVVGASGPRGTVVVIARYVDSADVPGNAWWSYTVPVPPTPATFTPTVGVGTARNRNTRTSCFYPRSNTSKAEAGAGYAHILQGYSLTAQKTNASPSDLIFCALATDTTTPGNTDTVGQSTLSLSASLYQISHTFGFGGAEQTLNASLDNVNIPIPAGQAIWFTAFNWDLAGAIAADADVSQWSLTCWGRTEACTRKSTDLAHYQGDRA